MTAATTSEVWAGRRHALRRRLQHFQGARPHQSRFFALRLRANALARQDERRQDDTAINTAEALAALHQLLHGDFKIAYDRDLPPFPLS